MKLIVATTALLLAGSATLAETSQNDAGWAAPTQVLHTQPLQVKMTTMATGLFLLYMLWKGSDMAVSLDTGKT